MGIYGINVVAGVQLRQQVQSVKQVAFHRIGRILPLHEIAQGVILVRHAFAAGELSAPETVQRVELAGERRLVAAAALLQVAVGIKLVLRPGAAQQLIKSVVGERLNQTVPRPLHNISESVKGVRHRVGIGVNNVLKPIVGVIEITMDTGLILHRFAETEGVKGITGEGVDGIVRPIMA